MKKTFKRLDLIVILCILALAVLVISIYYAVNKSDTTEVEVYYQNTLLYSFDSNTETRRITINNGLKKDDYNNFEIVEYGRVNNEIKKSNVKIKCDKSLSYQIDNKDGKITVSVSNCPNHLCEKMVLSSSLKTPIICTNGITIKYKVDNFDIISK